MNGNVEANKPSKSKKSKQLLGALALGLIAAVLLFAVLQANKPEPGNLPTGQDCSTNPNLARKTLSANGVSVEAEVAESSGDKYQGLSGRNCIGESSAMLFPYDQPGDYCFVMRNMNFPIDMVWLDSDKKIVYIKHDARPENYPDETYCPDSPAQHVIEVRAGKAKISNWEAGTQFTFD